MAQDAKNFLLSLAAAIAEADGDLALGEDVFALQAVEVDAGDTYGVFDFYGGPPVNSQRPINTRSVQFLATSPSKGAAFDLADRVHAALFARPEDEGGQIGLENGGPARAHWAIAGKVIVDGVVVDDPAGGWMIDGVGSITRPATVGRDPETMKFNASFNCDVTYGRDV